METGLKGRVAIVAASSQGIGKTTAMRFAAEGAKVALCARNQQALDSVAADIESKYKVEVFTRALDVTDAEAVRQFVAAVGERFGRIDICVTNAGGPPAKAFSELTNDDWRRAFELNLLSTVSFCREVIPWMQRQRWGRIVTITSSSVKQPIPDLILSNSIRTGVVGLVKSLANLYGRDGILVNNVGPGYTATDRLKELAGSRSKALGVGEEQMYQRWADDTATGKIADPEDVANTIVWLASEAASSITGQTVLVDNGAYRGL
ncbi:MAG TPA: SDR family oxidoreductase [Clostridia bacterium]|nr:SDR family oxidoreductase [Clostridia bacterium]